MRLLFVADISHDLRTPLTILRGEAEVALRDERPAKACRETLRRVEQLARRMGRLVDELLFVFNRFHRGRQEGGRSLEGSGLGLPIAKWILDTHGGSIAIESEAGRTIVTLRLSLRT